MYIVQYVHVLMVLMYYRCALSRITAVPCLNVLQVCIVSVYYRCDCALSRLYYRCAYLVGNVQEYVTACLELIGKCILQTSDSFLFS